MMKLRTALAILFSCSAVFAIAFGLYQSMHSALFLVQVVEVANQPETSPVDSKTIEGLAAIPTGRANLFELNLSQVEKRILSNPWIREVQVEKHFPQTVSISVSFRKPRAFFQNGSGQLSYIDDDGTVFGRADFKKYTDLPLFQGFGQSKRQVELGLGILAKWESSKLGKISQISSLDWSEEKGFEAVVMYSIQKQTGRTLVDLGHEFDGKGSAQLENLASVFEYLSRQSIAVRQIWADAGKKIVVKTARGS